MPRVTLCPAGKINISTSAYPKVALNLLATEFGDTARFTGSGEIECLLTGVK